MEHSALHAIQLLGVIVALGGPIFILGLVRPSCRALGPDAAREIFAGELAANATRTVIFGALAAALGTLVDLFFVQVAEVRGKTIFGSVDLPLALRFATGTTVGQLSLLRAGSLIAIAVIARQVTRARWWLVLIFALGAAVLASLVSHAAAQPHDRAATITSQLSHLTAGAAWLGVLIHLLLARRAIQSANAPACAGLVAEIIRRFSPVALTAAGLLALSGGYGLCRYLATPAAVPTSAYGLTLVVKVILIVPLLCGGYVNYRIIRPGLLALAAPSPASPKQSSIAANNEKAGGLLLRFGRMVELEVTAGVLVITVAGILASVSPPGDEGALRLTSAQIRALAQPDLPTTAITNPATFYGEATRTLDDLRYSQFTHNWSGVFVCLLGCCWLVQSLGGRVGAWAGQTWPFLLVPFGAFIALAADPEVWWLRRVSIWQAVSDPQLLEHQLGAVMVLLLVWLGWRDGKKPRERRPLGHALPVLMILGSLLLLGHAHSTLSATEELTNLVNVQHAVFGMFGLLAGTVRWLELRGLFRSREARWIWPGCVIGLGLFMTFFYREVV